MKTKTKKRPKLIKKHKFNKRRISIDLFNKHGRMKGVNNKNPNDRLEILKANCEQEIRDTEEKLRQLKAKLNNLITLSQESDKLVNPQFESDKYVNFGMTEAILDAVECLKNVSVNGVPAIKICDHLIAHGFKPSEENPHNFVIAVSVTLKRLADSGRIKRLETIGGNFFKPIYKPQGSSLRRITPSRIYRKAADIMQEKGKLKK
jgi:hypothetical protein